MKYRKKLVRVDAIQLRKEVRVVTDSTTEHIGLPGDWLLVHDDGRQETRTDEAFRREYELDVAPAPAFPGGLGGTRTLPYTPNNPPFPPGPLVSYCATDASPPQS